MSAEHIHPYLPVIVKEIGAGISATVARKLLDVGVRIIDVAGAGGTSWAGVELLRRKSRTTSHELWDWGIPSAHAVRTVAALRLDREPFTLIASGGISSALDVAKCIALGADLAASARPMITAIDDAGRRGLHRLLDRWTMELRSAMFLTGSRTITDLQQITLESTPGQ